MFQPYLIRQGPKTQKLLHLGLRRGQAGPQGGARADTEPIQPGRPTFLSRPEWGGHAQQEAKPFTRRGSTTICAHRQP